MLHLLVLFALAVLPLQRPTDVVKWAAAPPAAQVAPGGVAVLTVTAKVQRGWKLYALEQPKGGPIPLSFAVEQGSRYKVAEKAIQGPKARVQKQDANFTVDTYYYENEVKFSVPVNVSPAPGAQTIPLEVTFQACGAELCLRPFTEKLAVPITVGK